MTDPGDEKLSRRYRELAREEPPAALDTAILKAARERAAGDSGTDPKRKVRGPSPRWMGPISIAAVLVLGIGVSLRMQMEKPGIETSVPESSSSAEYPMAQSEPARARQDAAPARAPAPPPAPKITAPKELVAAPVVKHEPPPREAAKALAKRLEAPAPAPEAKRSDAEANPFTDGPVVMQQAPVPASPPAAAAGASAPQSAPLRAKRENFAADRAAVGERRIAAAADPDPNRELERIALLREAARHAEADRALEEFRRRHPDFRIPDALWERVRPR